LVEICGIELGESDCGIIDFANFQHFNPGNREISIMAKSAGRTTGLLKLKIVAAALRLIMKA
jgi:hypothetical protein